MFYLQLGCIDILTGRFYKVSHDIKDLWNNLGGVDTINSFEKKWCEWSIDDTIEWFKFVLNQDGMYDAYDYEIEDCSINSSDSSDSSGDDDDEEEEADEKKQEMNEIQVDFQRVRSYLSGFGFNAKKDLPTLVKPFQFERFGFKNKKDCKLVCKKTKGLVKKYPRKSKKAKKKNKTRNQQDNSMNKQNDVGVEGFVEDTN